MKRFLTLLLAVLLLGGCTPKEPQESRYQATFLELFDTVTTIVGYAPTEEAFSATAEAIHDDLEEYHQLFDIYNTYPGVVNLKTLNDTAATAPVKVDEKIMELLKFCREVYDATSGKVNIAMGSVLQLWHEARESGIADPANAKLPEEAALTEAAKHTDLSQLILDEEAGTVFYADPEMSLDVGAIAKGYALEQVCKTAPEGLLISVGGNVRATGPKPDGGSWVVGIQNPTGEDGYLHTLEVQDISVVTSGDYQRYYTVDGVSYHHIIDPETLYPGRLWRAVTVLCHDSGLADGLSTALFLLPQAEGQALLDKFGCEALWVDSDNNLYYSPGFRDYIRT